MAETRQTRRILAQRAQLRRLIRLHPGAVFSVYTTGDTLQLVGAHGIAQEWWGGTYRVWRNYDPRTEHTGTTIADNASLAEAVALVARGAA